MNYIQYLEHGGPSEEWKNFSFKKMMQTAGYIVPGYGTYLSVKDAIDKPTWYNITAATVSGIGDVLTLFGVGAALKAASAGSKALKAGKAVEAARAAKEMRRYRDTTIGGSYLKGLINGSFHGPEEKYHPEQWKTGGSLDYLGYLKSGNSIHIKPENKGKFTETKKRTGKTTEELTHSKNPLTRKRAIFAQNAKKWNHKKD